MNEMPLQKGNGKWAGSGGEYAASMGTYISIVIVGTIHTFYTHIKMF